MENTLLDALDKEITRPSVEDGRIPIGSLAKRLKATAPALRKRIKRLEKEGLLKVSDFSDPQKHP